MEELLEMQGQRCECLPQNNFFAQEALSHGVEKTVLGNLLPLFHGLAGAALHPIICVSRGILSRKILIMSEGLACLNHSYLAGAENPADISVDRLAFTIAAAVSPRTRDQIAAEAAESTLARNHQHLLSFRVISTSNGGGVLIDAQYIFALKNCAS